VVAGEALDVVSRWGTVRVQRWGSPAAPLLLGLPGLSGTSENFAYVAERIAGADLQLVALDLRGRGYSETTARGTYGWERHAEDAFAVAGSLGYRQFSVIGQSMGGSVAMKMAELDSSPLRALVLVDVAGRVDPGVAPVIATVINHLRRRFDSPDHYVAELRGSGLIEPWSDAWERACRYGLRDDRGGVRPSADVAAVAEDRAYTATQDPYQRWSHLTMPTLLVRARRELTPGAGFVVPTEDRDRFLRTVTGAEVLEIDGNHLTVNTHPDLPPAVRGFLARVVA
jgi:pimeloyl-ACP methyl ester carboxylesterase